MAFMKPLFRLVQSAPIFLALKHWKIPIFKRELKLLTFLS